MRYAFSIDEAIEYIYQQTNEKITRNRIFYFAMTGKLRVCFYKPNMRFAEVCTDSHKNTIKYCSPLKNFILLPERDVLANIDRTWKSSDRVLFPVVKAERMQHFVDDKREQFIHAAYRLDALSPDHEYSGIAIVHHAYVPHEKAQYEKLKEWLQNEGKACPNIRDPDEPFYVDPFIRHPQQGISGNEFVFMVSGNEGCIRLTEDDFCIPDFEVERFLSADLIVSTSPEPKVIKGKPETLRAWMKWVITEEKGLTLTSLMPDGLQARLIERAEAFGYTDNSAIKRMWAKMGLDSARNTKK